MWSGYYIDPPNYSSRKGTRCYAICFKLQDDGVEPKDSCPSTHFSGSSTGGSSSGGGSSYGGGTDDLDMPRGNLI